MLNTVEMLTVHKELSSQIANFISYLNKSTIKGKKFEGRSN